MADDSENFWKVAKDDSAFWDAYVSTRPRYSSAFYKEVYSYHAAHSSSWALAHDIGCGAGQVTTELISCFQHVVASDMNDTHLAVAQQRLQQQGLDHSRIAFSPSKGEDLHLHHPSSSADLIAVPEAIVLMDVDAALACFATLLGPGGTLAIWFYGRPTFADPVLRSRGQPRLDAIISSSWDKAFRGSGDRRRAGLKRASDAMASWLDYIAFNPGTWSDVRRIKWNPKAKLSFFGHECGFEPEPVSNVREWEAVEEREDPEWWRNDWSVGDLKKYARALFPGFREAVDENDVEIAAHFQALAETMGGETKTQQFTWPVVLILATRK
ncbi:MAG: hypothetical protein LQ340_000851 [Diploschistes diacapsis]|nr:MAG: hypothetical protein LQ340_000851 [Diploschistes diacapsis]